MLLWGIDGKIRSIEHYKDSDEEDKKQSPLQKMVDNLMRRDLWTRRVKELWTSIDKYFNTLENGASQFKQVNDQMLKAKRDADQPVDPVAPRQGPDVDAKDMDERDREIMTKFESQEAASKENEEKGRRNQRKELKKQAFDMVKKAKEFYNKETRQLVTNVEMFVKVRGEVTGVVNLVSYQIKQLEENKERKKVLEKEIARVLRLLAVAVPSFNADNNGFSFLKGAVEQVYAMLLTITTGINDIENMYPGLLEDYDMLPEISKFLKSIVAVVDLINALKAKTMAIYQDLVPMLNEKQVVDIKIQVYTSFLKVYDDIRSDVEEMSQAFNKFDETWPKLSKLQQDYVNGYIECERIAESFDV